MGDAGTPPVIPDDLQVYNSYIVDPHWQRRFTTIWPSALAFFLFLSFPHWARSIRNGRAYASLLGVREDFHARGYDRAHDIKGVYRIRKTGTLRRIENYISVVGAVTWWMVPGLGMSVGQIALIAGYITAVIACIVIDAPLVSNSNRAGTTRPARPLVLFHESLTNRLMHAGFIALAQLPVVFLFATKNSPVAFLLGPGTGYEKLNYVHRWSGRVMFLGAVLHGALWIKNHLEYGLPIVGQQKEGSGVAALGLLGALVFSSLPVARRMCYQVFYALHMLSFVGFLVTICYHTIYAEPWLLPPLAFYGLDILVRMFRHRIKDAVLEPVGNQMTLIHIPHATSGWLAGQHIRLRVFFSGRIFESHPLTIYTAPPDISCISSSPPGISLGARAVGDWTGALNAYAVQQAAELGMLDVGQNRATKEKVGSEKFEISHPHGNEEDMSPVEVPVQVMIDGPYGGCSVDLGEHETALLFAGGSGITFTLGVLDDIVGRVVRKGRKGGERTRRIEFAWCVRSFGSIDWFAPALMDIARVAASSTATPLPLDLHISIYVTCLCNPQAVSPIPNCTIVILRPSIYHILRDLTLPRIGMEYRRSDSSLTSKEKDTDDVEGAAEIQEKSPACKGVTVVVPDTEAEVRPQMPFVAAAGAGLAVCASGPEGLVREVANAVARMQISGEGVRLGGIALHTEMFAL